MLLASGLALSQGAARGQEDENPTTPGAIPNPGTYQGSMQLQHQSDQQDQQFRQQQAQPQPYYQPTYPTSRGGPPGPGYVPRSAPPPASPARSGAEAFGKESAGDLAADKLNARRDYVGAVRIWRPLAERGDVNAQYNLGVMYDLGHGVPANKAEAALWYRRAAEKGMGPAMLNLGAIIVQYARSPADLVPAYTWFRIAATRDAGVRVNAERNMGLLMQHMSYNQITRAEAAAHAWAPR
jgi:TPR repeat protein